MNPMPEPCRYSLRASANLLASGALNGRNARWQRLKTVDALTEVNCALPWISPVAMRMLVPSSVGSAISRGDTRANAALPSSSSAVEAHNACSSKDLSGPGSMARLRNTFAFDHKASWSYGVVTALPSPGGPLGSVPGPRHPRPPPPAHVGPGGCPLEEPARFRSN